MPYILVDILYPLDKREEVAKTFLESIKKLPFDTSLGTEVVPSATTSTLEGIKVVAIAEIKEGKLESAFTLVRNRMLMFSEIQGFKYETRLALTSQEALGTLDMKLPT